MLVSCMLLHISLKLRDVWVNYLSEFQLKPEEMSSKHSSEKLVQHSYREVSAQEAVYRIMSLPMKQLSRSVVFVNTNPKHEQIAVLKSHGSLS